MIYAVTFIFGRERDAQTFLIDVDKLDQTNNIQSGLATHIKAAAQSSRRHSNVNYAMSECVWTEDYSHVQGKRLPTIDAVVEGLVMVEDVVYLVVG